MDKQKEHTQKAAFFDLDGTLIQDVHYLSNIRDIVLLDQGVSLAQMCQKQGYKIIIVTNQSGIARGYFDEKFIDQKHACVQELLQEQGVRVLKFYVCPHHHVHACDKRYKKDCLCRKPRPGMLIKAAQDFSLDLSQSLMFGDKTSDVQAGQAAGCMSFKIK